MTRVNRVALAGVAVVLLLATALLASRARSGGPSAGPTPGATTPAASGAPAPVPDEPSPSAPGDRAALLRDPDLAEAASAEALLAAGTVVASGDWSDLGSEAWAVEERPVYVGAATVTDRTRVSADLVIAFRSTEAADTVTLRLLPAARAITDVGGSPTVAVRRGGRAAGHEVDRAGARLVVTLDPPVAAGEAVSLRVTIGYDLVAREAVLDDGGPAGFGLLASNPSVSVLGHWLPLLTVAGNDGAMIPWGDVGAFPAAVWSLQVEHGADVFVSGADDGVCPTRVGTDGCTWARGVALRDVSAVVYSSEARSDQTSVEDVRVRAFGPPQVAAAEISTVLAEAAEGVEIFTQRFGPLAWREFDVVAAPLSSGAAGMEFPGLVIIRQDTYTSLEGGFGTYVVAHEVAHQWFHALLANGSLSDPVVDESLAQYASVLYYADRYGEPAADDLAARYITGRYERWRAAGGVDEPPGQPLADFDGSASYGPLVYARGAMAWLAAEEAVGRDEVTAFVRDEISRYGLARFATDEGVVADAERYAPRLGEALRRYWLDPEPVG